MVLSSKLYFLFKNKKTITTTQDPLSNFMSYLICHRKFVSIIMLKPFGHGLGPGEASSAPTWYSLALFGNWIDSNYMFYCRYTHRIHGAAIYGSMDPINIPQVLAYIPAPWILWDIKLLRTILKIHYCGYSYQKHRKQIIVGLLDSHID